MFKHRRRTGDSLEPCEFVVLVVPGEFFLIDSLLERQTLVDIKLAVTLSSACTYIKANNVDGATDGKRQVYILKVDSDFRNKFNSIKPPEKTNKFDKPEVEDQTKNAPAQSPKVKQIAANELKLYVIASYYAGCSGEIAISEDVISFANYNRALPDTEAASQPSVRRGCVLV